MIRVMNLHLALGIISGILAVVAVPPYVKDILKGTTRPNIVSWGLWTLIISISLVAQISAGASWSLIFMIGDLIGTSTVLVMCLIGYGYKKYGKLEVACFALAIVAIIIWQITRQPILAILFSIAADFMASLPTVAKAYKDPWSEDPSVWIVVAVASALGIISNTVFNAPNVLFPAYVLFINALVGVLSLFGRRSRQKPA